MSISIREPHERQRRDVKRYRKALRWARKAERKFKYQLRTYDDQSV